MKGGVGDFTGVGFRFRGCFCLRTGDFKGFGVGVLAGDGFDGALADGFCSPLGGLAVWT